MRICLAPGCNNEISLEGKNNYNCRYPNGYCQYHSRNGIETKCEICGKPMKIQVARYEKNIEKEFTCRSCNRELKK